MNDETTSQGMLEASASWKRQGQDFFFLLKPPQYPTQTEPQFYLHKTETSHFQGYLRMYLWLLNHEVYCGFL